MGWGCVPIVLFWKTAWRLLCVLLLLWVSLLSATRVEHCLVANDIFSHRTVSPKQFHSIRNLSFKCAWNQATLLQGYLFDFPHIFLPFVPLCLTQHIYHALFVAYSLVHLSRFQFSPIFPTLQPSKYVEAKDSLAKSTVIFEDLKKNFLSCVAYLQSRRDDVWNTTLYDCIEWMKRQRPDWAPNSVMPDAKDIKAGGKLGNILVWHINTN